MAADPDLAAIGRTLGDTHRAQFLLALLGGEELAAGELAMRSGASSSLASAHLTKLLGAGLVTARKSGRQRLYRIAGIEVAEALESLIAIAPPRPVSGLREVRRAEAIREARTCYDHLAGRLGVALTDALELSEAIVPSDSGWELTPSGERRLHGIGVDVAALRERRRAFIRSCVDWTEHRPHLAGALGAALSSRLFELEWVRRIPDTRAVELTSAGRRRLRSTFALDL